MKVSHHHQSKTLVIVFLLLCVSASLRSNTTAQVRPVNDYGAIGLGQLLKRLNTTASVMMIGAHPDDEDSALLAYLARGENARTAYLSLTRGDGGQNIIGPELFESLGVIRTEELLQARRLDGAEQYFTRAFDYGFSKTLAEARAKWDEKIILCDAVRAIRLFRPLVVISRFSGTPNDGHGQHQYAGYISPFAVKAAADPQQCKDSGEAWQVLKFYVEQGFSGNDPATLRLNTGAYDPILGRTYFEIAMEGRSQHRSQGEGRIEFHGDQFSALNLVDSKVPKVEKEISPFDGIDTSATSIPGFIGMPKEIAGSEFSAIQASAKNALANFDGVRRDDSIKQLLQGLVAVQAIRERVVNQEAEERPHWFRGLVFFLDRKETEFTDALRNLAGIQIDALADKETVVPGEDLLATVKTFFPKNDSIRIKSISLGMPTGWHSTKLETPKESTQGFNRREVANAASYFKIEIPGYATLTQPYWLQKKRDKDLFQWAFDGAQNVAFEPPLVSAEIRTEIGGSEFTLRQPLQFRYADPARGEIRRDLNLVPSISVGLDHDLLIIPESNKPQKLKINMSITNNSGKSVGGIATLKIDAPKTWSYTTLADSFRLKNKGDKTSVVFEVTVPPGVQPGSYNINGQARIDEGVFNQTMTTIAYPHIQTHRFYTPAETAVTVLDLKVAPVKVGYIMGSGDDVPEAIRQMGNVVTMLEEKDLASGDLSKFDTIVVGIRASETRPDFVANNGRLLDYVKNGGNLIVQYQRGNFAASGLAPYPVDMADKQGTTAGSIARVVDENAPVTILAPSHPVFLTPNKITPKDFEGWVQERNAYNIVTFDKQYLPLLESHDAGEAENKGGLVIATVGKGNWVYCSYSFFRQLPAGVPGAYRLFANLISLPK